MGGKVYLGRVEITGSWDNCVMRSLANSTFA